MRFFFSVRLRNYFCLFFNQKVSNGESQAFIFGQRRGNYAKWNFGIGNFSKFFESGLRCSCSTWNTFGNIQNKCFFFSSSFEYHCEIVQSKLHNSQINIGSCIKTRLWNFRFFVSVVNFLKRIRFQLTFFETPKVDQKQFSSAVCLLQIQLVMQFESPLTARRLLWQRSQPINLSAIV